jgi:complement component 1 Q subcomponent-binding protein
MFHATRRSAVRGLVTGMTGQIMTKSTTAAMVPAAMKNLQVRGVASLGSALLKEYKEETDNAQMSEEFLEIKSQIEKTFTIEDKPGSSKYRCYHQLCHVYFFALAGSVKLTSTFKGENIVVSFDVQDEVLDESQNASFDEEGNFEGNEEGGEDGEPYVNRFIVEVKQDSRTLAFDCTAGSDVEIRNVQILGDNMHFGADNTAELYSGPNFADLDDNLREAFYEYLQARKIDADFSFFVQSYAHDKEQREYINWLKSVGEFVGSKPLLK